MRLKMQFLPPSLVLVLFLVESAVSQNIHPMNIPIHFGSNGENVLVANRSPNDDAIGREDSPSLALPSFLPKNNQSELQFKPLESNISIIDKENEQLGDGSDSTVEETTNESNQSKEADLSFLDQPNKNKEVDLSSGDQHNKNEKQEDPPPTELSSIKVESIKKEDSDLIYRNKNEQPDSARPMERPTLKLEMNQNETLVGSKESDFGSRNFANNNEKLHNAIPMEKPTLKLETNQSDTLVDSSSLRNKDDKQELPKDKQKSNKKKLMEYNSQQKKEGTEDVHPLELPSMKLEVNPKQSVQWKPQKKENKDLKCPSTTADCLCFADKVNEHVIHVDLKTIAVVDPRTGKRRCFADEDPLAACEKRSCIIIPNNNFDILFQRGKKVYPSNHLDNTKEDDSPLANTEKNNTQKASGPIVLDTLLSAFYPVQYTYPRAIGEGGNSRVPRSMYGSNLCRVPSLANSEVTCWKWPNWQTCKQTCIYGHGLDNGGKTIREKSFNCRNTENKWKPHVIRDCEPYMNCKVHLKSPGDLNCVEPTDGPAYCDINCADYDDYVGHGKVRWKCEEKAVLHGKGDHKHNKLPHCAEFEEADLRLSPPDY